MAAGLTVHVAAVGGSLVALVHAIVAQHLRHPQTVIVEIAVPSGTLRLAMLRELPPFIQRGFIAKEGDRQ